MPSERAVLDLVGLIYDAAGNATRWPIVLERLGSLLRTEQNSLWLQEFDSSGSFDTVLGSVGTDPTFLRSYDEYYGAQNVYVLRGGPLLTSGAVRLDEALCPRVEALRTEFYNDWIAPQKQKEGIFAIPFRDRTALSVACLVRQVGQAPFDETDLSLVKALIPHLQRAIQLHLRMRGLQHQVQAARNALDHWSLGVILLDAQGKVILANRSGESILNRRDGLTFDGKDLRAATSQATIALRALIHNATKTTISQVKPFGVKSGSNDTLHPGGAMPLPRPSSKRPLQILVTPACANPLLFPTPQAAVAVFVTDPEDTPRTDEALLRQLYGLSRAEAKTAALLLHGRSLGTISDELACEYEHSKNPPEAGL